MKLILKRSRFSTMALTWLIVLSLSWGALAHGAASPPVTQAPWFTEEAAVPLSDDELAQVSGEVTNIIAGAIGGAVLGVFEFMTSPGEKTVKELVTNVAIGALGGAVSGAASALAGVTSAAKTAKTLQTAAQAAEAVTEVSKVAQTAAASAWAAWGGANAGALIGATKQLLKD